MSVSFKDAHISVDGPRSVSILLVLSGHSGVRNEDVKLEEGRE